MKMLKRVVNLNRNMKEVRKDSILSNITQNWVDVLIPFSVGYRRKISASKISRETNIAQQTVSRIMNSLSRRGFINYEIEGKNKMFSVNWENPSSSILMQIVEIQKSFLFNNKNPEISIILSNLKKYCDSIIVFGSYAFGDFNKDSDLDLVVFSANKKLFEKEKQKYPMEINCHFVSYEEFEKLLKEKNALTIEISLNHILFGNVSKLAEVFLNES